MSAAIDHEIIEAMQTYGGGFVQRLAEVYQFADEGNRRRIKMAFPELWVQYAELAGMLKARSANG